MTADAGFLSRENCALIGSAGAIPRIFRISIKATRSLASKVWSLKGSSAYLAQFLSTVDNDVSGGDEYLRASHIRHDPSRAACH